MGDPNAAIPTVQPIYGRPMWAFTPGGAALSSITWASQLSIDSGEQGVLSSSPLLLSLTPLAPSEGTIASYGLKKRVEAVKNCRKISKKDLKWNDLTPVMKGAPATLSYRGRRRDRQLTDILTFLS